LDVLSLDDDPLPLVFLFGQFPHLDAFLGQRSGEVVVVGGNDEDGPILLVLHEEVDDASVGEQDAEFICYFCKRLSEKRCESHDEIYLLTFLTLPQLIIHDRGQFALVVVGLHLLAQLVRVHLKRSHDGEFLHYLVPNRVDFLLSIA
jgi:hypothetical protein